MGATAPVVDNDEFTAAEMDTFFARNHDVLNESIERSIAQLDQGIHSKPTIPDIIADGRKRHSAKP